MEPDEISFNKVSHLEMEITDVEQEKGTFFVVGFTGVNDWPQISFYCTDGVFLRQAPQPISSKRCTQNENTEQTSEREEQKVTRFLRAMSWMES